MHPLLPAADQPDQGTGSFFLGFGSVHMGRGVIAVHNIGQVLDALLIVGVHVQGDGDGHILPYNLPHILQNPVFPGADAADRHAAMKGKPDAVDGIPVLPHCVQNFALVVKIGILCHGTGGPAGRIGGWNNLRPLLPQGFRAEQLVNHLLPLIKLKGLFGGGEGGEGVGFMVQMSD